MIGWMSRTEGPSGSRRWPLALIGAPAAVSIWSGWVGLGTLCGFGIVHPLPGIADGFQLNTAITLPVGVEAYGAYALGAWLHPGTSGTAKTFARRSAIGALVLGMIGQVAYHLLAAAHSQRAPSIVIVIVACMPVVTLGFGAALTHLLRAEPAPASPRATGPRKAAGATPKKAETAHGPVAPAVAHHGPRANAAGATIVDHGPSPASPAVVAETSAIAKNVSPGNTAVAEAGPSFQERAAEHENARRRYRESVDDGNPLSDRALAKEFGRSRNWGAKRIEEVEGELALASSQ